jgi:hypothetical protein
MAIPRNEAGPELPPWQVSTWLNTPAPITLASLRGRVVLLHAFQMLCPGCVAFGLPQAERVRQAFPASDLAVVGLHTVFEHHAVMTVDALRAFIHEYRWSFPIGVDQPDDRGGASLTMTRYGLRGTPSCIVLDRRGQVRLHHFGQVDDLALGSLLGGLIASEGTVDPGGKAADDRASLATRQIADACSPAACPAPEGTP